MELYCIKTHSQKVVIQGQIWPFISDKSPCKCKVVDVGIRIDFNYTTGQEMIIGENYQCCSCKIYYPFNGIWWIDKSLFANIDDISIAEALEEIKEKELV